MPVEVLLEVKPYGFTPATADDSEQHRLFAVGSTVKAKITKSKSRPMLRLYWAVVQQVADGIGMGKEQLSHELLCITRRIHAYHCRNGEAYVIPVRISRMHHFELCDYVTEALDLLFNDYAARESRGDVMRLAEQRARTTFHAAMQDLEGNGDD
jgi:hypothetical protein